MSKPVETLAIDLCALLMAPELQAKLLLSQAEKDSLHLLCYADLPRHNMRYALWQTGFLEYFDSFIYAELFPELTAEEFRYLASPAVLWLRLPADINYVNVLKHLTPRQRSLPRILRAMSLDTDTKLDTDQP